MTVPKACSAMLFCQRLRFAVERTREVEASALSAKSALGIEFSVCVRPFEQYAGFVL
jgi:hypothetical protein